MFNHSSYLAGAEVICAGCLYIGYNNRRGMDAPGMLAHIDNGSGHYKPREENLRNCNVITN